MDHGLVYFSGGSVCLPSVILYISGAASTPGFWCNDQSLSLPYKPDTVSQALLLIVSFGMPFFVMSLTEGVRSVMVTKPRRFADDLYSFFKGYGVFLFGIATTLLFTDSLKYSVGRLRPHFFDLCRPDFGKINCTAGEIRFISEYECTNTDITHKLLRDSQLSFPSGHASFSMYSAVFTIFYLQSRMKINFSYLLRPLIQVIVMLWAVFCCVSRIRDNKHFPSDVAAGTFIGATVAWLAFYKLAERVIPNTVESKQRPSIIKRATSIESEPQTPTPLLRPERLVLSNGNASKGFIRESV